MTSRKQHVRIAAVLAAGALITAACSGTSQVTEPADIDRQDVAVDVSSGAACAAIPADVVERHIPGAEPHTFDRDEILETAASGGPVRSWCIWTEGDPRRISCVGSGAGDPTQAYVSLYGFSDPEQASEEFGWREATAQPSGTIENGWVYGQFHEIAIGDLGYMQYRSGEDEPGKAEVMAVFLAGNAIVDVFILHCASAPWSEDDMLAAVSDIVASFGT